jgi:hypothetical protein
MEWMAFDEHLMIKGEDAVIWLLSFGINRSSIAFLRMDSYIL